MDDKTLAARLAHLRALDLSNTDSEPHFDAIVTAAAEGTETPAAMISLVGEDRQWFKAAVGVDHRETPLADSICAHAIDAGDMFVVNDLSVDPRFRDMAPVRASDGIRFYAGAPLRLSDGAVLGMLCVVDDVPRDGLDQDAHQTLETLARRTVAAFERRRDRALGPADDRAALLAEAARHLARASAALDHAGATGALAHLEHVIALVDELASPAD